MSDGTPRATLNSLDGGYDQAPLLAPPSSVASATGLEYPRGGAFVFVDVPDTQPLCVQARTCASCGRPFPALQHEPFECCRGCDRDGPRLTPEGLEAWRAVRVAHRHYHLTRGLAGGVAGGSGPLSSMKDHSNVSQREASLGAASTWWVHADVLLGEVDRLFPEIGGEE